MNKLTDKLHAAFEKLKKIKHIEIYIAVIFAVIIIAIYLSSLGGKPKETEGSDGTQNETFSSSQEYVDYLEHKLINVLTGVKGAGQVNVVITLENGFEYVYATEDETKTVAGGGTVTTSKIIMVDGKPVIEKEIYPTIKGVVIVATGANDITVKMNLLTAVQTVITVINNNITILAGN